MKVICYGDSNTWGYDPQDKFGQSYPEGSRWTDLLALKTGWEVINEGMNGREVPNEPIFLCPDTDLLLIMLGTNDLLQLDTPEAAAERMAHFLSETDPEKAVIIAPPPMVWGEWVQDQELIDDSVRLTALYKELAERMKIRFVDTTGWNVPLAFDGVHFTLPGQRVFAERLAEALNIQK